MTKEAIRVSDDGTVTDLHLVGGLPRWGVPRRLYVVPPPRFGRIRVTIAPLTPVSDDDDPAVPAVVLLTRVLGGLPRL